MTLYSEQHPEAARALDNVRVPGMPDPDPGESRSASWFRARGKRQVQIRNARIFRAWMQAEDRKNEIERQADVWGLTPKTVIDIIQTLRNNPQFIPVEQRSWVEGVRLLQVERITEDAEAARCEIAAQITDLEHRRNDGAEWADIRMKTGKYEGVESVPINEAILMLHERLQATYQNEASALGQYMPKPDMRVQHEHRGQIKHEASQEFTEIFNRLENHSAAIEAESEVIDDSEQVQEKKEGG